MENQTTIKTIRKGELIHAWIKHKHTTERSLISCDKIEYFDNHLMFYFKNNLVFKVWLRKDKYKDIQSALRDVDIVIR